MGILGLSDEGQMLYRDNERFLIGPGGIQNESEFQTTGREIDGINLMATDGTFFTGTWSHPGHQDLAKGMRPGGYLRGDKYVLFEPNAHVLAVSPHGKWAGQVTDGKLHEFPGEYGLPCWFKDRKPIRLPVPTWADPYHSDVKAINDSGLILGVCGPPQSSTGSEHPPRWVLWKDGRVLTVFEDLDVIPLQLSCLSNLSMVGGSQSLKADQDVPVLFSGGKVTVLPIPDRATYGDVTHFVGETPYGLVVLKDDKGSEFEYAAYWPNGVCKLLQDEVSAGPDWVVSFVQAVNNRGQLAVLLSHRTLRSRGDNWPIMRIGILTPVR